MLIPLKKKQIFHPIIIVHKLKNVYKNYSGIINISKVYTYI
jgi:hypothetical protein